MQSENRKTLSKLKSFESVHFDLDQPDSIPGISEPLDEVDEFLELSTLSNNQSTSSTDSNTIGASTNTHTTVANGTIHSNRKHVRKFSR